MVNFVVVFGHFVVHFVVVFGPFVVNFVVVFGPFVVNVVVVFLPFEGKFCWDVPLPCSSSDVAQIVFDL